MSARSWLADRIGGVPLEDGTRPELPEGWELFDRPKRLGAFLPAVDVTIVLEQRGFQTSRFSADGESIPTAFELAVWVVVDGSRGTDEGQLEDMLEDAAEWMIRTLTPLEGTTWDGTAERTAYDQQKPAYQFPVKLDGEITETPDPEEVTP